MKLQLALDGELQPSLTVLQLAAPYIDIVEIGTPLIYRNGKQAIHVLHEAFPYMPLLADLKIMDAGEDEAGIAFDAGADFVTIMGVTNDSTVRGAVIAARRADRQIMADLMQVVDPVQRGRELLELGCDYLCVHTAYDLQSAGHSPIETLKRVRHELPDAHIAVAGGINLNTIDTIVALRPNVIIVGSAITRAADIAGTARALHEHTNNPIFR